MRLSAKSQQDQLAIVYTRNIRPYISLKNRIVSHLEREFDIGVYELQGNQKDRHMAKDIQRFDADVICCFGDTAHQFCKQNNLRPLVLAYDTEIFSEGCPFCLVDFLNLPDKRIGVVEHDDSHQGDHEKLSFYDYDFTFLSPASLTWQRISQSGNIIIFDDGLVLIKAQSSAKPPTDPSAILISDNRCDYYNEIHETCLALLPNIDPIIDITDVEAKDVSATLANSNDQAIICIGSPAMASITEISVNKPIFVAIKAHPFHLHNADHTHFSAVTMFTEPRDITRVLTDMIDEDIRLAIPYSPRRTEWLVLKTLLHKHEKVQFHPIPIESTKQVGHLIDQCFHDYDGMWMIPNKVISSSAAMRMILEESLKNQKILISMMHPITKAGGMIGISSVGKDDAKLAEKVIELIYECLQTQGKKGHIISPPSSISLNLRTLKRIQLDPPKELIQRADYIYGND